jgi:hypothetical protein
MKSFAVMALFVVALLSLGMAVRVQADIHEDLVHAEPSPARPAADSGAVKKSPQRGRPGEDDTDEEDEEDLRAPPPAR